jgi:hypothetical protein
MNPMAMNKMITDTLVMTMMLLKLADSLIPITSNVDPRQHSRRGPWHAVCGGDQPFEFVVADFGCRPIAAVANGG